MQLQTLPLSEEDIPDAIRRFANLNAPKPAMMMVAKGMTPVRGKDLMILLAQLSVSEEVEVQAASRATLKDMPVELIVGGLDPSLPNAVIHFVYEERKADDEIMHPLVALPSIANQTLELAAKHGSEELCETIALNQQRLLEAPEVIEALYMNPKTRMSTADRLIELAARNKVRLDAIPSFDAHVEAIQGQLIFEPSDEALPDDELFNEAVQNDVAEDAIDVDDKDGSESVRDDLEPLMFRIRDMNLAQKIRFSTVGDAAARSILIRDPNKLVYMSAARSPKLTEKEVREMVKSRQVADDVLRYFGNRKEWMRSHDIKRSVVFNPKTPIGTSMKWLAHMQNADLKALTKSRDISGPLKRLAKQKLAKKEKKK